jgi:hypothetical protein
LFYGLYNSGFSDIDSVLLKIIAVRGELATLLDTLFLGAGATTVASQVLFDMLTAALDRAIDLLAMGADGTNDDIVKQERAFAYWLIIRAILQLFTKAQLVFKPFPPGKPIYDPGGNQDLIDSEFSKDFEIAPLREEADKMTKLGMNSFGQTLKEIAGLFPDFSTQQPPPHLRAHLTEELLIQKSLEKRWRELVRTVAPEAARQEPVFNWLHLVIMQGISVLDDQTLPGKKLAITWDQNEIHEGHFPPQYEQSLALIARGEKGEQRVG